MLVRAVVSVALAGFIVASPLDAQTRRRAASSGGVFACDDKTESTRYVADECSKPPNPTLPTCGDTTGWRGFDFEHGRMRLWIQTDCPADERLAMDLIEQVESDHVWDQVSAYLREPLPDGTAWCDNGRGNGGGPATDVYLVHNPGAGTTGPTNSVKWYVAGTCQGAPVYLHLERHEARTIAHELIHAAQASYVWKPDGQCLNEHPKQDPDNVLPETILWWAEATATAGELQIYPGKEHDHALITYLNCPERPLDAITVDYGYVVYLFPQFLEKVIGVGTVRRTWENLAAAPSIVAGIDAALKNDGGLEKVWPQFSQMLVNQPPWDKLKLPYKAKVTADRTLRLNGRPDGEVTFEPVPLHRLSTHIYHLTVDSDVRSLTFVNPFYGKERITLSALVKYAGRDAVPEDWTKDEKKYFCLDKRAEQIEEVTLVVSNSTFASGAAPVTVDKPMRFIGTNIGCWRWKGSSTVGGEFFSGDVSSWRLASATFTVERRKSSDRPQGRVDEYAVIDSQVQWRAGTRPCGTEKSGAASNRVQSEFLEIYNWHPDAAWYRDYWGFAATDTEPIECQGALTSTFGGGIDWFGTEPWMTTSPSRRVPSNGLLDDQLDVAGAPLEPGVTYNLRRTWKLEPLREE